MSFVPASNCSCHGRSNRLNVGTADHLFTFLHPLRKQGVLARFFSATRGLGRKDGDTEDRFIGFFLFMSDGFGFGHCGLHASWVFQKTVYSLCHVGHKMRYPMFGAGTTVYVSSYIQFVTYNINRLATYMNICTYSMHTICAGSILDCLWSLEGVETVSPYQPPFLFRPFEAPQHGTYQNSSHMSPAEDRCRPWGVDRAFPRALLHCNAVNLRSEPGFLRGVSGWVL